MQVSHKLLCLKTTQRLLQQQGIANISSRRSFSQTPANAQQESQISRIFITGSLGQIGTELIRQLRSKYGKDNVVASDVRKPARTEFFHSGPFVYADVLSYDTLERIVVEFNIDTIIHNSSILSAVGERDPVRALQVNTIGIQNVLEIARKNKTRIFAPSSIAAFGPSTPQDNTPDLTIMRPRTIYGVSKLYLELLGEYYHTKFGVDFRSLRYPGVISSESPPGGGTTDYAIEMFHYAVKNAPYECFLNEKAMLPMMYMHDCLRATLMLLEAPNHKLTQRVYNVGAFSFTPKELENAIRERVPSFKVSYRPDFRQDIAESWPNSIDDSKAREDWNWRHDYDMNAFVEDMLHKLGVPH